MPNHIEEVLTKMIRDFIWDQNTSPRIALEHLFKPIKDDGLNLLNIKAWNKAIKIVWLKSYLNLSPSRPSWATVTDLLINAAALPGTSAITRTNTFTQSWKPPTKGPHAVTLGEHNLRMLSTAKKYNTNLTTIHLSPELYMKLPLWYHPFAKSHPMTNAMFQCLLRKNNIRTVVELVKLVSNLEDRQWDRSHIPALTCTCSTCSQERARGCDNPHTRAREALTRIHDIAPKYNPLQIGEQHDKLSLMH